jgi:hypothetical protein
MSLKANFAQTAPITCSLFLLLSSTAWADPKAPVVSVKQSVQTKPTLNTGSQPGGAGHNLEQPSFFKGATSGEPFATDAIQYRRTTNEPLPKRKGSPRE